MRYLNLLMILFIFGMANGCVKESPNGKPMRSYLSQWGLPAHVQCFSGDKIIYEGDSEDRVQMASAYSWSFFEKGTHSLIRVTGSCVVKN